MHESEDFALEYKIARHRIDEIDRLMRQVDARREELGMSKAELARMAGLKPEAVRRLLTARTVNPTLLTVVALATAVGLQLSFRKS
ncbi:MAG: helix-turn-helix domain-containing protein [Acidimicrobiales bacterium]